MLKDGLPSDLRPLPPISQIRPREVIVSCLSFSKNSYRPLRWALSNPVRAFWLATFWMLYPSPMVSAVRGNTSTERSVEMSKTFTGGGPGGRISLKVGNDNSLAANGSSVLIVAGKKRSPAKPWANAGTQAAIHAAAQADHNSADFSNEQE